MSHHSRTFPFWPAVGGLASVTTLALSLVHGYVMQDSHGGAMTPLEPRAANVYWRDNRLYVNGYEIPNAAALIDGEPGERAEQDPGCEFGPSPAR